MAGSGGCRAAMGRAPGVHQNDRRCTFAHAPGAAIGCSSNPRSGRRRPLAEGMGTSMTTKTITGHYPGGYTLNPAYGELRIAGSASVEGSGVKLTTEGTVFNSGYVSATNAFAWGTTLENGGDVVNEASGSIDGAYGVRTGSGFDNAATVTNYGAIAGSRTGVDLTHPGGTLRNVGVVAGGYYGVLISGGTVSNSGEIYGGSGVDELGVLLQYDSSLANGALNNTTALISGATGVATTGGSVSNFGTIEGQSDYSFGKAVLLGGEASLTNGAPTDRGALIVGDTGVYSYVSMSTVTNFGTIEGSSSEKNPGIRLEVGGGAITNGSSVDTTALIEGYTGIDSYDGAATVTNFGVIDGTGAAGAYGVVLEYGGGASPLQVINGSGGDKSALIEGNVGVELQDAAGTVKNFGTILANDGAGDYGVCLKAGGRLTNGAVSDATALIEGYGGVELLGGTATNFGTIRGTGAAYGYGAELGAGTSFTNGAASDKTATVEGHQGVFVGGATSTLTNFGALWSASGGPAVEMYNASDTLVVEAGSTFIGSVLGGAGKLDLASGVGTLTGLLAGGNVVVSGSMATTAFTNFGTLEVGAGATFTADGASSLAAGQSVIDAGTLTIAGGLTSAGLVEATGAGNLTVLGALSNSGTLQVDKGSLTARGAVTGTGVAVVDGGVLDFASTFTENVTFNKSGTLELGKSRSYSGAISGFSKSGGTLLDLKDIKFANPGEASFSGTATSGVLTVSDGTHTAHITLTGNYTASTFTVGSDDHGGVFVIDPAKGATSVPSGPTGASPDARHRFIAAMAGFGAAAGGPITQNSETWRLAGEALAAPRANLA
jgi:hypothetical protein